MNVPEEVGEKTKDIRGQEKERESLLSNEFIQRTKTERLC